MMKTSAISDQERMREDRTFINTTAAATANMSIAERLEIQDDDFGLWKKYRPIWTQAEDDEALIGNMVLPFQWVDTRKHNLGTPPDMVTDISVAMKKAGVRLDVISIKLTSMESLDILHSSKEDRQDIVDVVQRLKRFGFRTWDGSGIDWEERESHEINDFTDFMSLLYKQKDPLTCFVGFRLSPRSSTDAILQSCTYFGTASRETLEYLWLDGLSLRF
ncbi:hypothetical protein B0J14DRAFT_234990 [Halenospora varia]|nr:hypothetical protein B0J14DRAFT_234990 [Halenospora varia]